MRALMEKVKEEAVFEAKKQMKRRMENIFRYKFAKFIELQAVSVQQIMLCPLHN